jgi:hypothetical protein
VKQKFLNPLNQEFKKKTQSISRPLNLQINPENKFNLGNENHRMSEKFVFYLID